MNAFALHHPGDRAVWRWTGSAVTILAAHAGVIALGLYLYSQNAPPGVTAPPIMLDLSPVSSAQEATPRDVAPGPEMVQEEAPSAPPPEPQAQQQVEEMIPPTPLMEKAEVVAPPEQKIAPTPPPPEPAPVTPEPAKPTPVKPKPIKAEVKKKPKETKPAPRTTAPQSAETVAPSNSAAMAGASRAAAANYRQMVQAHVQRFKQYPAAARTGRSGKVTTVVTFTLGRSGQVLSVSLSGSSGQPALDAETLATVRRASPFPAFPAEMTMATQSYSLPLSYNLQ
ncbi:energy transducer TonB [Tardiphaga alba]|uniref:Energy transducer TonB n=1 Tax=Tardiphaga alba TaxID=340268 RepID=A0ABX8AJV6_9BRAD|nr:TonB family protein [Tardiphaga alba]QUS42125.1 energy transducer TonB [Tardiphaga alba]